MTRMEQFTALLKPVIADALHSTVRDAAASIALTIEDEAAKQATNPDVRAGLLIAADIAHRLERRYAK